MSLTRNHLADWGDGRDDKARGHSVTLLTESYSHFCRGYQMDAAQIIRDGLMPAVSAAAQQITIAPLNFYSLCEHHMLPFFGTVEISYTAGEFILGLGKFPRVVEALSARLWMQENLTAAIADTLAAGLKPKDLSVILMARHLCLEMRGAQTSGAQMVTHATR